MQAIYRVLRRQPWLYDRAHDSLHPGVRRFAHRVLRTATAVAGVRYRLRRYPLPDDARLHLGSGRHPLRGWINVDLNPFSRAELWWDLRNQWPIPNESVSAIYARHCFEHFPERELRSILRQCARVLRPGGGIRIGVPSLDVAVRQYLKRDFRFTGWLDEQQPAAKSFFAYITDNGNHAIVLDFEYLEWLLTETGFTHIRACPGGESGLVPPGALSPKDRSDDWTLYVEAVKPPVRQVQSM